MSLHMKCAHAHTHCAKILITSRTATTTRPGRIPSQSYAEFVQRVIGFPCSTIMLGENRNGISLVLSTADVMHVVESPVFRCLVRDCCGCCAYFQNNCLYRAVVDGSKTVCETWTWVHSEDYWQARLHLRGVHQNGRTNVIWSTFERLSNDELIG